MPSHLADHAQTLLIFLPILILRSHQYRRKLFHSICNSIWDEHDWFRFQIRIGLIEQSNASISELQSPLRLPANPGQDSLLNLHLVPNVVARWLSRRRWPHIEILSHLARQTCIYVVRFAGSRTARATPDRWGRLLRDLRHSEANRCSWRLLSCPFHFRIDFPGILLCLDNQDLRSCFLTHWVNLINYGPVYPDEDCHPHQTLGH